jgi:hypothetical protein
VAISAYSDILSVFPSGTINLYISTDAPQFRVEWYRLGATLAGPLAGMPSPDLRTGQNVPAAGCPDDWGWPGYAFTVPASWSSGIYIAMLVEVDQNGNDIPNQPLDRSTADGIDRKAMFVVRQPTNLARALLFKVPTATYAAYNYTGNGSTYRVGGPIASLRRPGLGTGGVTTFASANTPYYQVDVYDPNSDRMKVVHIEQPFIRFLENVGYIFDYCNDFDLHFDNTLLDPYQLLLSVGHDEYWSQAMRDHVVAMLERGGNVAFFSGNTCFKYIEFPQSWQLNNKVTWPENGKPVEDSFTGVSYRHANGRWDDWRQAIGYSLQHLDHWALRNVSGVIGDVYPDNGDRAGLIGYECDGTPSVNVNGVLVPSRPNGLPTPPDFLILGSAQLDDSWQDPGNTDGTNMCTMGLYTDGGVAFTAGTVDWGRVLGSGREPRVETLTRNVIDRLSVREPGWWPFGGQLTSVPVAANNADGRLEAFARDHLGGARHVWQVAVNNGWSTWASEGGTLAGNGNEATRLAMASDTDGRLELFARFDDNSIRHLVQDAPNYTWAPWASLGGNVAGDPCVAANLDGRLEVFVRGFDGQLYHSWQQSPGGTWNGWASEGGSFAGNFAVARNADGRLEVFGRDTNNAILHNWQTSPNNGWGGWASLGGNVAGDPCVAANLDGRLEVFVRGFDGQLYHSWQQSPGGTWNGWASEGGSIASNLAVERNGDGRLEVFARFTDNGIWHIAQTGANNGWGTWSSFGGLFIGDPAIGVNGDGRFELFAVGVQHSLWHRWQTAPGVW